MALTIREKIKVLETVEALYEMVDNQISMYKNEFESYKPTLEEDPEDEYAKKWSEEAKQNQQAWEVIREAIEGIDRTIKM